MQVTGDFGADLETLSVKKHGQSGTRMANVLIKTQVDKDQATKRFGDDFTRVAFSGMMGVDGVTKHTCAVISKPNLVVQPHVIELLGHKIRCTPEVPKIVTVAGEPSVVVHLVLPLPCASENRDMVGDIATNAGEVVQMQWEPVQVELPLSTPPKKRPRQGAELA